MITTANIYKALRLRLEKHFKDINIQIKDIKNIDPPCIYIEYANGSTEDIANETTQAKYLFNIAYFSEEETLIDLTTIEKKLKSAFIKPLKVFYTANAENEKIFYKFLDITNSSTSFDEINYVLTFAINFDFIQPILVSENNEKIKENVNPYDDEALYDLKIMEETDIKKKKG